MPPKPAKKASEPSKKTEAKKKEKIIEDKTFGLKNKKGGKQQKFIKMVNQQVTYGQKSTRELEKLKQDKESKKDQKKKELEELNALFKPVEQKVAKGVDPKSVLCAFFKSGKCGKGDKCKFSHDLTIARKSEKRSVYDDGGEKEKDTMDNWNEDELASVIEKKHGEQNKKIPKTSIICKYFLEAVENSKYGWFWSCPNGESCHYRHALPPGFVLKKDKKLMEEVKQDEITLEELIETERAALSSKNLTKVTLESFLKWKEKKKKEKISKLKQAKDKKKQDYSAGKAFGISGKEMFEFNPDLVAGDDADEDDASVFVYKRDSDSEDEGEGSGPVRDINENMFSAEEVDGSGTVVPPQLENGPVENGDKAGSGEDESTKLDMAGALPPGPEGEATAATNAACAASADGDISGDIIAEDTPIDENLFDGEDLDLVEEELETLDLD